jgi:hypothetical protein
MTQQVNIIVFSKDRACQASACVESLYKHFKVDEEPKVTVLWTASNQVFADGYSLAKKRHETKKNVFWKQEKTGFRNELLSLLEDAPASLTMFLVDDIIFVDDVLFSDKQLQFVVTNPMLLATSLRLHENVTHCYATDSAVRVPNFVKGCVWPWPEVEGDWAYPMSVDGNIYRTDFIKRLISSVNFSNPNTLEAALDSTKTRNDVPRYLCCYTDGPRLINIPANRVQNIYKNRYAKGFTAEELNDLFLQGKRINIDAYHQIKPNTVHVPIKLEIVEE